jgi:hypothetical protein
MTADDHVDASAESRMLGNGHVRFGGRRREDHARKVIPLTSQPRHLEPAWRPWRGVALAKSVIPGRAKSFRQILVLAAVVDEPAAVLVREGGLVRSDLEAIGVAAPDDDGLWRIGP